MSAFEILPFDSELFGHPVARLEPEATIEGSLRAAIEAMKAVGVVLAYAMVPWDAADLRAGLESAGAALVDRKVGFGQAIPPGKAWPGAVELWGTRAATPELEALALASGVHSRFKIDPRVPGQVYPSLYLAWIRRSVAGEVADAVLITRAPRGLAGMVTVKAREGVATIGLIAVDVASRGRGVGRRLVEGALGWAAARRCARMEVVTQGENLTACALYRACGFQVILEQAVYHLWLQ